MSAIITDQIRILNAKNFVAGVSTSTNSYYTFVGLSNPTDYLSTWNTLPPAPKDNFREETDYWDTMIAMKKITTSDVRQVVPRRLWNSGTIYDMYRHDYSRTNTAPVSGATSLYSTYFYVLNSDYRVYICLQNGTNPDTPNGNPSLDEPTFTELEPRSAGSSGDGYIWKYLYTIKPADIAKFESTNYMPVPEDWDTSIYTESVRDNAIDGSIKIVVVTDKGVGVGPVGGATYTNVPIRGNGTGAECTITTTNDQKIDSVVVTSQGYRYTYGNVDLVAGGVPTGSTRPTFDVIMTPKGGHGADIYRELGAYYVLVYSRIENDIENPDFITGNEISRIGIVENPSEYDSNAILIKDKASVVKALRLVGTGYSTATFTADDYFTQTVSTGTTAVGRVVNYDQTTGVLKFWQDRSLAGFNTVGTAQTNPTYGYTLQDFTSTPGSGGTLTITPSSGSNLTIDDGFVGVSAVINSRTYYLGQEFEGGISNPEVQKYTGNIIYVDNRPPILRSTTQKEDIKVVLQF